MAQFDFSWQCVRAENDVPQWMDWCDLAIATAGSATWELACCGVPTILSIVADNQIELACWCEENRVALSAREIDETCEARLQKAWATLSCSDVRLQFSTKAMAAIDGQGAARIVQQLWPQSLGLRRATLADAQILWEWRNNAQTRAMSLQSEPLEWEPHWNWLRSSVENSQHAIWIVTRDLENVAVVRFHRQITAGKECASEATISVTLAPEFRGQGLSKTVIKTGCRAIFGLWPIQKIRAQIKTQNVASLRAFEACGFVCHTQKTSISEVQTLLLERSSCHSL